MSDAAAAPSAPSTEAAPSTTDANPAQPQETAAQQQARLLAEADMDAEIDLKINGQVQRKKLRDVVNTAQKQEAAENRMREAKKLETQARQVLEAFRDPNTARGAIRELAKAYNIPPAELAKALWDEEQTEAAKTPEQRELEELRREKQRRMEEEKRLQEEREQKQMAQQQQAYQEKFVRLYNASLDALGFPKDPDLRAQAMAEMATRHKVDQALSFRENARLTAENYQKRVKSYLKSLPVDKRPELLDEETVQHLANQRLAQRSQVIPPVAKNPDQPRGKDGKFVERDEYRAVSVRSSFHDAD